MEIQDVRTSIRCAQVFLDKADRAAALAMLERASQQADRAHAELNQLSERIATLQATAENPNAQPASS